MSDLRRSRNAFSSEYLTLLEQRDEPEGPWADPAAKPLVILNLREGYGLFHPWQDPRKGDEPMAVFENVDDARLALVARAALRQTRHYRLHKPQGPPPPHGFAVLREGEVTGSIRNFEPEWIDAMNVLTVMAQSPEGLAMVLYLAGPSTQEEVGEILGGDFQLGLGSHSPGADGDEQVSRTDVRSAGPDEKSADDPEQG